MWVDLNHDRYKCEACNFRTPNLAHWCRHDDSVKHFLMTTFRDEAPRDIKILVASWLPFVKLTELGQVGLDAVNMVVGSPIIWLSRRRIIQRVGPGGLPARTVYLGGHSGRNLRSLAYVL
jgi:hypothetical protein